MIPAPKDSGYRTWRGHELHRNGNPILEDMAAHDEADPGRKLRSPKLNRQQIQARAGRCGAAVELKLRQEFEMKLQAAYALWWSRSPFNEQRSEYFARVEAEVVQLALAIAAKILHRKRKSIHALASLVRMAIERCAKDRAHVRVGRGRASKWKEYLPSVGCSRVECEDASLSEHDCLLETELGVANFGLDTQLKEVEQGFFDLLALKP